MNNFTAEDTLIIVGIVIVYILFTTWLTFRLRSKTPVILWKARARCRRLSSGSC